MVFSGRIRQVRLTASPMGTYNPDYDYARPGDERCDSCGKIVLRGEWYACSWVGEIPPWGTADRRYAAGSDGRNIPDWAYCRCRR